MFKYNSVSAESSQKTAASYNTDLYRDFTCCLCLTAEWVLQSFCLYNKNITEAHRSTFPSTFHLVNIYPHGHFKTRYISFASRLLVNSHSILSSHLLGRNVFKILWKIICTVLECKLSLNTIPKKHPSAKTFLCVFLSDS